MAYTQVLLISSPRISYRGQTPKFTLKWLSILEQQSLNIKLNHMKLPLWKVKKIWDSGNFTCFNITLTSNCLTGDHKYFTPLHLQLLPPVKPSRVESNPRSDSLGTISSSDRNRWPQLLASRASWFLASLPGGGFGSVYTRAASIASKRGCWDVVRVRKRETW